MATSYVIVDDTNADTCLDDLHRFATTLDLSARCNAAAAEANHLRATYPSRKGLTEFVERGALIVVAYDDDNVIGYMIGVDDSEGRGGCRCRWIGVSDALTTEEAAHVYATLGDFGADQYGWLWGRVTNVEMRNIMAEVPECVIGDDDIVTYRKP